MKAAVILWLGISGMLRSAETVRVEPLGLTVRSSVEMICAVVGGETAKVDLSVEASAGAIVQLGANLTQIAGVLAAPWEKELKLGPEMPFPTAGSRQITVDVPVPEVQHRTLMKVAFLSLPEKRPVGQMMFAVYPKIVPGELAAVVNNAEKAGGRRLAVFGASPAVRKFFHDHQIAFEDLGEEFPRTFAADLLVLAEVTHADLENHRPDGSAGHAIFFVADKQRPPGVYQTLSAKGSLTKVTLPMLDDVASNPQNRSEFINLIHRHLDPSAFPEPL